MVKSLILAFLLGWTFLISPGRAAPGAGAITPVPYALPGQVRGNHLHPGHEEWLYPFHGAGVLLWEATPGKIQERVLAGNRCLVHLPPGVAHALKNPGPEILYLLAWREAVRPVGQEPETVPRALSAG